MTGRRAPGRAFRVARTGRGYQAHALDGSPDFAEGACALPAASGRSALLGGDADHGELDENPRNRPVLRVLIGRLRRTAAVVPGVR
jgi:hypothetical protein